MNWFDSVAGTLGSVADDLGAGVIAGAEHVAAAPPEGGHFAFEPAALRSLVTDWTELGKSYEKSKASSDALQRISAPGMEYASESHASVASSSGTAYISSLDEKIAYCYTQADKCQRALDDYMGVEHHTIGAMRQVGNQGGGI